MTPEIMDLVVKAVFGILALMGIWLVGWVKDALKARVEAEQNVELYQRIYSFVAAADQMLKAEDPDGSKRKAYVVENLMALGIAITQEVNALIEAAVYEVNLNN